MERVIEATNNDLAVVMQNALEAAMWLSTAATRDNTDALLREKYLEGMKSAMVAAEQARQMAGREHRQTAVAPTNIEQGDQ